MHGSSHIAVMAQKGYLIGKAKCNRSFVRKLVILGVRKFIAVTSNWSTSWRSGAKQSYSLATHITNYDWGAVTRSKLACFIMVRIKRLTCWLGWERDWSFSSWNDKKSLSKEQCIYRRWSKWSKKIYPWYFTIKKSCPIAYLFEHARNHLCRSDIFYYPREEKNTFSSEFESFSMNANWSSV